MKTRSKALLLSLCAILLVASTVFGTLAYLTDTESAVNTFTVGNVSIFLDEADVNEAGDKLDTEGKVWKEGATLAERVQTNEYHLLPGHSYVKDPTVHVDANSEDCYVRMYVTINMSAEWDAICDTHKNTEGKNLFTAGDIFQGMNAETWVLKNNTENAVGETSNTRTYEFWYNTKVAKSTTQTNLPALFSGIKMPGELTNDDLVTLKDFKIYVVAQAVQADGFDDATDAFATIPAIEGTALTPAATSTPIPGTPAAPEEGPEAGA